MDLDRFESAARDAFAFLERDHALTFRPDSADDRDRHWWVSYLTYFGGHAFVRVALDDRDRAFNVLFGPLRHGDLPPYPIFLERDDEPLTWFPLWAVLEARRADVPRFSFAEDGRLDVELTAWTTALREHATDALRGDFDDLEGPVRRVKAEQLKAADALDRP